MRAEGIQVVLTSEVILSLGYLLRILCRLEHCLKPWKNMWENISGKKKGIIVNHHAFKLRDLFFSPSKFTESPGFPVFRQDPICGYQIDARLCAKAALAKI